VTAGLGPQATSTTLRTDARQPGCNGRCAWDLGDRGSPASCLLQLSVGADAADAYEKAIEGLVAALFYPVLTYPVRQRKIHQGRKRIDITYTNMAGHVFFEWVARHYPSEHLCRVQNYGNEIGNPELDQIAGRFSAARGKVGLIACRNLQNRRRFEQGCRDTAVDNRGYVIALDDADLLCVYRWEGRAAAPL
jgi:hypothetical protein